MVCNWIGLSCKSSFTRRGPVEIKLRQFVCHVDGVPEWMERTTTPHTYILYRRCMLLPLHTCSVRKDRCKPRRSFRNRRARSRFVLPAALSITLHDWRACTRAKRVNRTHTCRLRLGKKRASHRYCTTGQSSWLASSRQSVICHLACACGRRIPRVGTCERVGRKIRNENILLNI